MRAVVRPFNQLGRIQTLKSRLDELKQLSEEKLKQRPAEKKWSVLEVIKHMAIGHNAYKNKINEIFDSSSENKERVEELRCSSIPSYLIKRFPPKDKKIRFKMKTSMMFKPMLNGGEDIAKVISDFESTLDELETWVNRISNSGVSLKKFNSAIGPIVRFNVPEATEFILCHNERHFQQIENTLYVVC